MRLGHNSGPTPFCARKVREQRRLRNKQALGERRAANETGCTRCRPACHDRQGCNTFLPQRLFTDMRYDLQNAVSTFGATRSVRNMRCYRKWLGMSMIRRRSLRCLPALRPSAAAGIPVHPVRRKVPVVASRHMREVSDDGPVLAQRIDPERHRNQHKDSSEMV